LVIVKKYIKDARSHERKIYVITIVCLSLLISGFETPDKYSLNLI